MVTNRLKGFDWLATVFYPLTVVLMEAFWVSPWLTWLGIWPLFRGERPVLNLVSVIIVLAVSLLVTRVVFRLKLPMLSMQFIIIGCGAVVMLLVVAAEYADGYTFLSAAWFAHAARMLGETFSNTSTIAVALPVIIYLWWRGIMLGQSTSYFKDIYRSFILGMVMLILLIILWQITVSSGDFTPPGGGIGLNVIAFFFFGLLAIAICHLYVTRGSMPREDAAMTSVWCWLPLTLGVIGVMVLIGFGAASLFSPDILDTIGRGLSAVGGFLGKIIGYILMPFVYIIAGLVYAFRWFLNLIRSDIPEQEGGGPPEAPSFGDIGTSGVPPWVNELIKWVIIAAIIALIIFILARTISRFRARRAREEMDETSESLFSWSGLKDDLNLFFNMLGQRFRRKAAPAASGFDPDAPGRLDIREIFRRLQWEGRTSGVVRRRAETAAEYATRLGRYVPENAAQVNDIEGMYESVRYGETSPPAPEVDKANNLWQVIRGALRRLRGE